MTIRDERDLRAQLGSALDGFAPGSLPMQAVVGQARKMINKRRAAAAAVAAAAALIAGPLLARQVVPPPPTGHNHVTVYLPRPSSVRGLIARGQIGGHRWLAAVRYLPSTDQLCFDMWQLGSGGCSSSTPPRATMSGAPLRLVFSDGGSPQVDIWQVRDDVAYVRATLTNGQVLKLRPRAVFGSGYAAYVALALPDVRALAKVAAYARRGELAYAMPFDAVETGAARWLKPSQAALPRPHRYLIGSARAGGSSWLYHAFVGPWGTCFSGMGLGTSCQPALVSQLDGAKAARTVAMAFRGSRFGFVVMAASPAVSRLVVRVSASRSVRVRPVTVGDGTLYCFPVDISQTPRWTAYSAAGKPLASGQVP